MHKLILWVFQSIRDVLTFLKITCVFFIMMLALYWIQNIIGAEWTWMAYIKYPLDWILGVADKFLSFSFDFWGATFEIKYVNATILLVFFASAFNFLHIGIEFLEDKYDDARRAQKKLIEDSLNKVLKTNVEIQEKRLKKYSLFIQTKVGQKYINIDAKVDLDSENKKMNEYLSKKFDTKPMLYKGGFLYQFDDFEKIDNLLDELFKILKSNNPVDYAMCIQIDNDVYQLSKLSELKLFGKITMAADTSYRYRFNRSHRYQMINTGIFQNGIDTLEVHEFQEML